MSNAKKQRAEKIALRAVFCMLFPFIEAIRLARRDRSVAMAQEDNLPDGR